MKTTIALIACLFSLSAVASQITINDAANCSMVGSNLVCGGENLDFTVSRDEQDSKASDEDMLVENQAEKSGKCHRFCINVGIRPHECFKWKVVC